MTTKPRRVLLVHPSALLYSEVYLRLEPLGMECVGESIRAAGHEVRLLDRQRNAPGLHLHAGIIERSRKWHQRIHREALQVVDVRVDGEELLALTERLDGARHLRAHDRRQRGATFTAQFVTRQHLRGKIDGREIAAHLNAKSTRELALHLVEQGGRGGVDQLAENAASPDARADDAGAGVRL